MSDVTIFIPYDPPLDWEFLLDYLRKRQTAGVESIDGHRYSRTVQVKGDVGVVAVSNDEDRSRLIVRIDKHLAEHVPVIERRVRRMFDLEIDLEAVRAVLSADPRLRPLCDAYPGIRVPGAWSAFELLARTTVGQQVSISAATTVMGRIVAKTGQLLATASGAAREQLRASGGAAFGEATPSLLFPTPKALAVANLEHIGLPARRAAALQNLARLIAAGELPFSTDGASVLGVDAAENITSATTTVGTNAADTPTAYTTADQVDLGDIKDTLLALPGIGPWTVAYFSLRVLRDTDAWPETDLILRRALERHPSAGARSVRAISDDWRPYRAYAAVHLWNAASRGLMA